MQAEARGAVWKNCVAVLLNSIRSHTFWCSKTAIHLYLWCSNSCILHSKLRRDTTYFEAWDHMFILKIYWASKWQNTCTLYDDARRPSLFFFEGRDGIWRETKHVGLYGINWILRRQLNLKSCAMFSWQFIPNKPEGWRHSFIYKYLWLLR
jgi:hypothetical protein